MCQADEAQIKKRREKAYLGSWMHFFRLLWSQKLAESNFAVYDLGQNKEIGLDTCLSIGESGEKYLDYPDPLMVRYRKSQISYVTFRKNKKVLFGQNGFFDPTKMAWRGYLTRQRVGDFLPYEYTLSTDPVDVINDPDITLPVPTVTDQ